VDDAFVARDGATRPSLGAEMRRLFAQEMYRDADRGGTAFQERFLSRWILQIFFSLIAEQGSENDQPNAATGITPIQYPCAEHRYVDAITGAGADG
jgi:hypothetical protein